MPVIDCRVLSSHEWLSFALEFCLSFPCIACLLLCFYFKPISSFSFQYNKGWLLCHNTCPLTISRAILGSKQLLFFDTQCKGFQVLGWFGRPLVVSNDCYNICVVYYLKHNRFSQILLNTIFCCYIKHWFIAGLSLSSSQLMIEYLSLLGSASNFIHNTRIKYLFYLLFNLLMKIFFTRKHIISCISLLITSMATESTTYLWLIFGSIFLLLFNYHFMIHFIQTIGWFVSKSVSVLILFYYFY